jgi:hypothetical protein
VESVYVGKNTYVLKPTAFLKAVKDEKLSKLMKRTTDVVVVVTTAV